MAWLSLGMELSWYGAYLPCTNPWVQAQNHTYINQVWQYLPISPALRRWRQEDQCYLRLCSENKVKKKRGPTLPGGSSPHRIQEKPAPSTCLTFTCTPGLSSYRILNLKVGQLGHFPFLKNCRVSRAVVTGSQTDGEKGTLP